MFWKYSQHVILKIAVQLPENKISIFGFENDVFISMELSIVMFWKYSQHGILIYSFLLDVEIKDLLCGVDIKDVSGKLKTVFVYVV
jgi:hypothetical protein